MEKSTNLVDATDILAFNVFKAAAESWEEVALKHLGIISSGECVPGHTSLLHWVNIVFI